MRIVEMQLKRMGLRVQEVYIRVVGVMRRLLVDIIGNIIYRQMTVDNAWMKGSEASIIECFQRLEVSKSILL